MKKLKLYIGMLVGLLATMLTACTSDLSEETVPSNSKGEMTLSFKVSTPDYKIGTRSEGYNNEEFGSSDVQIFCFDANGYFLGMGRDLKVVATSKEEIDKGAANTNNKNISVKMPNATARLHIIAKANINTKKAANEWIGLHENKLITTFESKADENQALKTKYWGYCCDSTTADMKAKLTNSSNVIHLIRDRAKITADWEASTNIQSVEISIGEGMKYATIAAFDRTNLVFPNTTADKEWKWNINDITLPKSEDRYKGSVGQMGTVQYCFEDENSSKNPVSCILKVTFNDNTEKWYKVYLQNEDQQFYKIKRNYTYAIHIQKLNPKLGYTGYDDALNGYAANNPWIQVEQIVPKISDGIYTLEIPNGTNVMLNEGAAESQEIAFKYEGGDLNQADRFDVNWVTNNELGKEDLTITYADDGKGKGKGKIGFTRDVITDQLKSGEIRILDKVSGMSRTIKIYSITKFDFGFTFPGYMSGRYKDNTGTLTYTIPKNYPSELLPVEIRIASNTINPEDCDVEVGSTEEITEGQNWNCWFLKKFDSAANRGEKQTITLKNIRDNKKGYVGSFYVKAKYGGDLQKFEIKY
ncbi:MAG: hypothetical protein UE775_03305 [Segatella copri]|nr:hypothetical protein [Segatella copri]